LGLAYQRLNNMDMAIQYHGLHRDLVVRGREALAAGDGNAPDEETLEGELRTASYELNKMYRRKAEHLEGQERVGEAIELYRSGLGAAEDTANPETVGQANYRLGRALILVEESQSAVSYLNVYLESSLDSGNVAAQGQAYSALAAAHQALGSTEDAVTCLQQYLKIAKTTDNLTAQAEACCNLGVIHNRRGEYKKAVHFFGELFLGWGRRFCSFFCSFCFSFSSLLHHSIHD
jgi:tetratricopeptide (TPR) repeat protein